jgi:DNA-binding CsgD family transcriptional regulator
VNVEVDVHSYVKDLERHLQLTLFCGGMADPEGAVLLVRGALADGDQARAVALAKRTLRLAMITPGDPDMAAAADHARGLIEQEPATLQRAAGSYAAERARASALEDAGNVWARQGDQGQATTLLKRAYDLYEEVGDDSDLARVRSGLRAAGTRLRHWSHADRPAFGWDSLTDAERRITDLVAEGLSNRQVANRVFLSTHTVAFHLRHIFWKLDITSRVQLARIAAEQDAGDETVGSTGGGS